MAPAGADSLTAARTFWTDGLKNSHLLATGRPFTMTVSSPVLPSTNSTSTPGSCLKAAAKLAACLRTPPHDGHSRIVTFFIAHAPFGCYGRHTPRDCCMRRAVLSAFMEEGGGG
jgi:hypothetical protein